MKDSYQKLIEERRLLCIEKYKLSERIEELNKRIDGYVVEELIVSQHAIERFEQRLMKMPKKAIKTLLSEPALFDKYKRRGAGKYQLKGMPNCICVVKDWTVVTVYPKNDPIEQLNVAREWIHYNIDRAFINPISFREFKKNYYK